LNLETVFKDPKVKDAFNPGRDPTLTVLFGGWLDTARRSPFVCAGLYRDGDCFKATLRLPSGRHGMGPEYAVHAPPTDQDGALPLLKPRAALLSHSFYFDAGKFWQDRAKIFTPTQVKTLEGFEKDSGAVLAALAGQKFSKLLTSAGTRHRFVAVNQPKTGYAKREPRQRLPAFAVVSELRRPEEFAKSMGTILRGVAFAQAGGPYKPRLCEEKHGAHTITGYRFAEDTHFAQDVQDLRYNFSPCFVRVGNQFIASSTLELCHELIDLLEKEAKDGPPRGSPAALKTRLYAEGAADGVAAAEDQLLAQTVLRQAVSLDEARAQTRALVSLVRRLGLLDLEIDYGSSDFHVDVRWNPIR
jgi:hypothetical protein